MRFHQLSIGQRFRFEGETYVKINALVASCERTSHHRVIRRSAEVAPLAADEPVAEAGSGQTPDRALDAFRVEAQSILDAVAAGGDARAARARLDKALDRLAQALQPEP